MKGCSERQGSLTIQRNFQSLRRLTFLEVCPFKVSFEISSFLLNVNDTSRKGADSGATYELEIERNQPSRLKNLFVAWQISRSYESAGTRANPMTTAAAAGGSGSPIDECNKYNYIHKHTSTHSKPVINYNDTGINLAI